MRRPSSNISNLKKLTLSILLTLSATVCAEDKFYSKKIQPLLEKFCVSCHGPDKMKSGLRVDTLGDDFTGKDLFTWEKMLHVLETEDEDEAMPPENKKQPTAAERKLLSEWISKGLEKARRRNNEKNGSVRRLTKEQYRNTLRDLLHLDENLAKVLPDDAVSKDGFRNNGEFMQLSPLQMEYYFNIAQKALDLTVVDPAKKPQVQNFRMDLGSAINPQGYKGKLILGYANHLLASQDFRIREFDPEKTFQTTPFRMRRKYNFIEGYAGNGTVRGMKKFDDLAHSVFACMRGKNKYANGLDPYNMADEGLLLRPSIPTSGIFGQDSTLGPNPNFKISLRELPANGNFRVKVKASKYDDILSLEKHYEASRARTLSVNVDKHKSQQLIIPESGVYQLDLRYASADKNERLKLQLNGRQYFCKLDSARTGHILGRIAIASLEEEPITHFTMTVPGDTEIINLSELQIYKDSRNIAPMTKVTLSSTYGNYPARLLIDGNKKTFAHTTREYHPSVKVQFKEPTKINSIVIWNRKGFEDRFNNAEIVFYNGDKIVKKQKISQKILEKQDKPSMATRAFKAVYLEKGPLQLALAHSPKAQVTELGLTHLAEDSPLHQRFTAFRKRNPFLGLHLGFRRDDGSTLAPVGEPVEVSSGKPRTYTFEGSINDFPTPVLAKANLNYLAGIREIGVRSEYITGADMPRLQVQSVEFEGPFYKSWPPQGHQSIFIESANKSNKPAYAADILKNFMKKAYRRDVSADEFNCIHQVWQDSYRESMNFRESIKDALLAVLTSPQFLFIIENSKSKEKEDLDDFELASKLSYFLWNSAPDQALIARAAKGHLSKHLDSQLQAMMKDPRFARFVEAFTRQWLDLDKFDTVETDRKKYRQLTRDTKKALRREPVLFLNYLIQNNLTVRELIQSDFTIANDVVANYYGYKNQGESGLKFRKIKHETKQRGGILTQASILAGLSDGRESNPVKRGTWMARKIVAMPPGTPPANVPEIDEHDDKHLTLREKLEKHRNQKGCLNCHKKIDPWGIPFESFDAAGFLKTKEKFDPRSDLPDGKKVKDLDELKDYLANERLDQVAFSFMKHLATYAVGRSLTFNEVAFLKEQGKDLRGRGYRMQDIFKFIVKSDIFLKK